MDFWIFLILLTITPASITVSNQPLLCENGGLWNGVCFCGEGWTGETCSEAITPASITVSNQPLLCKNGWLWNGVCFCGEGWTGETCSEAITPASITVSNQPLLCENGWLWNGVCFCGEGWTGETCSEAVTTASTTTTTTSRPTTPDAKNSSTSAPPVFPSTTFHTASTSSLKTVSPAITSTAPHTTNTTLQTHRTTRPSNTSSSTQDPSASPSTTPLTTLPPSTTFRTASTSSLKTVSPAVTSTAPHTTNTTLQTHRTTRPSNTSSSTQDPSASPSTTPLTTLPPSTTFRTASTSSLKTVSPAVTSTAPHTTNTTLQTHRTTRPSNTSSSTQDPSASPSTTVLTTLPPSTTFHTASTSSLKTVSPAVTSTAPHTTNTTLQTHRTSRPSYTSSSTQDPSASPSTTPLTTLPPSPTPLFCNSGSLTLDGICLCPDEWIGPTCSKRNFCEEKQVEVYTFPNTTIGWFSYSNELCPKGTPSAGKPMASAKCSSEGFGSLKTLQCDLTLRSILGDLSSWKDLEQLAASAQILTAKPEELMSRDVLEALTITNHLLLVAQTETVRTAAASVISQLLESSLPEEPEDSSVSSNVTQSLEQLSLDLGTNIKSSTSGIIQPNLVVQSAQIPMAGTRGVQFASFEGLSGRFVDERLKLNTNTSEVVLDNSFVTETLIFMKFSQDSISQRTPSNASLGFVLYQNDRLFRSKLYSRPDTRIRVLSGSVHDQQRGVPPEQVELWIRPKINKGMTLYNYACVFWDYSLGDWSTAGCYKLNATEEFVQCGCNHTSNFAALMSLTKRESTVLDEISKVGLMVSIVALALTVIHYLKETFYNQRDRQKGLLAPVSFLSICLSLLAVNITFLSGVQINNKVAKIGGREDNRIESLNEPENHTCTAVAALLHFFLLASFLWNSLYSTQLALQVLMTRLRLPTFMVPLSLAVGWGLPAFIMALTLGVTYDSKNPLEYRQETFCWLAALDAEEKFDYSKPMFWGFLLPVGLIMIYNVLLLFYISVTVCRTNASTSDGGMSRTKKFLLSLSLGALMGVSWTLGFLQLFTQGQTNLVLSVFFCILNSSQGLQIFILLTATQKRFRSSVRDSAKYIFTINIPLRTTKYSFTNSKEMPPSSEVFRSLSSD